MISDATSARHTSNLGLADCHLRLMEAYRSEPYPTLQVRRDRLRRLSHLLKSNQDNIVAAVNVDFGCRSAHESRLVEIVSSLAGIEYALSNLERWIKPRKRSTSKWFLPGSNKILPQPLGVVGVMAPWNYPVNLAAAPMAAAFAAGNRVMVRMSEFTPNTTELFTKLVADAFDETEAKVFGGDADLAAEFSKLPFDHLLFTGSTNVGRKIMVAAAENLTPLTLELGGKSPAIVAPDYPIDEAAERISWGKTFNAGQTCVAPDYAFVPTNSALPFAEACLSFFEKRYEDINSDAYTSIVADRFFDRLSGLVEDARASGAQILQSSKAQAPTADFRKFPYTIIIDPAPTAKIMREEIFGPLLLVRTYDEMDAVIQEIAAGERPLGLYCFTNDRKIQQRVLQQTHSGGVALNDVMLQYLQVDLPFGGVGSSGFGKYHGREGFETFSHLKPIFHQRGFGNFTGLKTLYPPYGGLADRMIKMMGG